MADKVQLIKEEIESYKESMKGLEPHSDFRRGQITAYNQIMQFINSLPEEYGCEVNFTTKSEDLEEEIDRYYSDWQFDDDTIYEDMRDICRHFAEWGRNHFEDKSEMVNEGLEEEIKCYIKKEFPDGMGFPNVPKIARHFAEWQKHQMKEALQTEYEKGRFDMIEEMTKDAVEGTIKYEIGSAEIPQCDKRYQVLSDPAPIANAKLGDKVKIVVLKTE